MGIVEQTNVKYIGCIGIKTSMRSLSSTNRSLVAKESINRICEAINIRRNSDNVRSDFIARALDDEPILTHSGTEVDFCVTSTHVNIVAKDTKQIMIQHEMPNVSFASQGDEDTINYVAYVAKNDIFGRACFVLECGRETAKRVLYSIALGFKLRTQQFLPGQGTLPRGEMNNLYNPESPNESHNIGGVHLSDVARDTSLEQTGYRLEDENQSNETLIAAIRASIEKEPWFHGSYLSREESETRLKQDGDFLVRESMLDPGRFVLSVMHDGTKLHLLSDSMGQVRTIEKTFKNIGHLIKYHHEECSPLVADNRVVYLRNGVRPPNRT